jgi:predicted ATPase
MIRGGALEAAADLLRQAEARVEATDERWAEAELHRVAGEHASAAGRPEDADARLARACETAVEQGAEMWRLRATVSRARLWRSLGRDDDAMRLLRGAFERFPEPHADVLDVREAAAWISPSS